jgi:acyl-coenzyme A synthetase/AMP-(fatty) acid ligase
LLKDTHGIEQNDIIFSTSAFGWIDSFSITTYGNLARGGTSIILERVYTDILNPAIILKLQINLMSN